MPEYMTKCEPVDKKPYIVYTDEKGILYSGDPDSDIPGGGGGGRNTVKCYILNDGDWETPLNTADVSVVDGNGGTVSVSTDELTADGPMGAETFACLSFTANVGGVYKIGRGTSAHYLTSGTLVLSTLGPGDNLPCSFEDGTLSFISPSADIAARLILG
jgi:hypothetical protein